ncbi:calcineurin-like phosphoesterase C-terminal domain-containing protein [Parapedobacter koreensis]|uniref:3',5'-cyclic AMP phosphodiesterase CpdA n=1 Tax=Parapedobacter koreensis TaxID=332977 RepID=A0A1H7FSU4_9SPHI|nr:calcineurin-like phosphoesterase C-terminal domain-containing protein [Parapedobacter koreensis]SEK27572.1 3',5'-cyclic AMP phosphodiesterase CpdA [Parapedobacter koreensis]
MNASTFLSIVFVFWNVTASAQDVVKGFVFEDTNQNGMKERREKGLAGVAVSNGQEVVLTDNTGTYELPIGNDDIVFVIKPAGYQVRLNMANQPQYYYIHKPNGSPTMEYKGVAPTGPLPKSVDFALVPHAESEDFRMLVLGDPQVLDQRELGYFERGIVSEIRNAKDVVMGITLGDLVQSDMTLYPDYTALMAQVGVPWYNVIGNHDLNQDALADSLHDETFEANFGPATYSFNYGKAHFIVLDDNLVPDPRGGRGQWSGYSQKRLDFMKNDLAHVAKDQLIVLINHIQLKHLNDNSMRLSDRQQLFGFFRGYTNVLALSAHTHQQQQFFYGKEDGWPNETPLHEFNIGATCGNWNSGRINEQGVADATASDGTPRGYVYLNISGNRYTADFKVAGKPTDYQIGLFHRKVLATIWWEGRGHIYANFFMGHKGSKMEYRINEEDWQPMRHTLEPDPAYVAELYRWDTADTLFRGRRPTEPANCSHLWMAPLTNDRGLGTHRIQVRATDDYGRQFIQTSSFRIEEDKY